MVCVREAFSCVSVCVCVHAFAFSHQSKIRRNEHLAVRIFRVLRSVPKCFSHAALWTQLRQENSKALSCRCLTSELSHEEKSAKSLHIMPRHVAFFWLIPLKLIPFSCQFFLVSIQMMNSPQSGLESPKDSLWVAWFFHQAPLKALDRVWGQARPDLHILLFPPPSPLPYPTGAAAPHDR